MPLLYSRSWYATVRRPGGQGPVVVKVRFNDSCEELAAWMHIEPTDMRVLDAAWEQYRSQVGPVSPVVQPVAGLLGVEATYDCGKAFNRAIGDDPGGRIGDLFKEGVKVLLQAELHFWKERGFESLDEFQLHLWDLLRGSCYYLAHPDSNPHTLRDKLAYHHRKGNLFSRHRSVLVHEEDGCYRVLALMSDGWHEMQLDLSAEKDDFRITAARANFVRGPDELCFPSAELVTEIVGGHLTREGGRQLLPIFQRGCAHLGDLTREAIRAVHHEWVQEQAGDRWPRRGGGSQRSW